MDTLSTIVFSILLSLFLVGAVLLGFGYLLTLVIQAFVKGWARFFNLDS